MPALSTAVPVSLWPAPSPVKVVGPEQLAIPEPVSSHSKLTVTPVLFQPLALASGVRDPTIVGLVVSCTVIWTVSVAVSSPSLTVSVIVWVPAGS